MLFIYYLLTFINETSRHIFKYVRKKINKLSF